MARSKADLEMAKLPAFDAALREYCDRNYHQLLPIIAEKVHQEKVHQEKLNVVKARLNFEDPSQHSESGTPSRRRGLKERLGSRHVRSMSRSPEPRRGHSESPRKRGLKRKTVFKRLEKGVFHRLRDKGKSTSAHSNDSRHRSYHSSHGYTESCYQNSRSRETELASKKRHNKSASSRRMEALSKNEDSAGGHWKSKPKRQKSSVEDDISQPWAAAKTERWAMPTWCHMFNSTLTENARVWFDDLSKEFIDSYDELKESFLKNYLQQKKCFTDPVEIRNIKQRDGESTEEFVRRYKLECRDIKGALECMKISGFMHGITIPELIKRLYDKIPKSVDEMMRVTTAFLRGEVAASNREWKKSFGFQNQQRPGRKQDRFTLLTKTPKEILALDKGKFKPPPPMTTPVEKRNDRKLCEFHREVGHTTDECMHLKRQIKEILKAGKLSHLIKELKQSNEKDHVKAAKKEETSGKGKPLAILMVQPWQRVAKQKITQTFSLESDILFTTCMWTRAPPQKSCMNTASIDSVWSEMAFKQMKKLIAELPMLTASKEKEELVIYLAAVKEAVSAVLMTERDEKQMPIYFVSRALQGSKINYTPMEKLILALVSASKRLKRYFQAHTIVVIIDQPIKQMLSNPEVAGRLLKWRFELEEHDIHYRLKTSVKGKILADFIIERSDDDPPDTPMEDKEELLDPWILFTNGSSCIDGSGAGLIITNLEGTEFTYALRFRFNATNNEAEYEALIADLRIAKQMGVKNLQANVDSKLVANHLNETYVAKEPGMIKYLEKVKNLASTFKELSIKQEVLAVVEEEGRTWMTPIHEYLVEEIPPEEKKKARDVRRKARRYAVKNGVLYKKSFLRPWLRCVGQIQANVLIEIYEGSCSMHAGPRSVVEKALRSGYYWPTMHEDARKLIRECNDCPVHRPVLRNLQQNLTPITSRNSRRNWHANFDNCEGRHDKNDEALGINLDLLEEKREQATIQEAKTKAKMGKYYNARVRNTSFRPGDFVYRHNKASHAKEGSKLEPKWEGLNEAWKL
nr:reverse transcriptase domain-containing protein [Tanacetum cinerariifolium]